MKWGKAFYLSVLCVVFELDAKSVDGHRECDVAADGQDQVHSLLFVKPFAESGPCLI